MNVGYIGLGRMGGGMVQNLLKEVKPLFIHDSYPEAASRFDGSDATVCGSPAEIATNCTLIFLCLPFAPAVRETLFGENGIAGAVQPGTTIVDMTTLYRSDALDIGKEARDKGFMYWDCPVSGMPFRADNATLTIMFGGTADAFAEVKPYLDLMGTAVTHCGPLGSGQAMKAINNILYNINIAGLAEVLPLSVKAGLDPMLVAEIVTSGSSRSFASEYYIPKLLEGDFTKDFPMEAAYKDIVNVQEMAKEFGASMPVTDAMVGSYDAAMEMGYGEQPKSAMLHVYEKALGAYFRKPGFEED